MSAAALDKTPPILSQTLSNAANRKENDNDFKHVTSNAAFKITNAIKEYDNAFKQYKYMKSHYMYRLYQLRKLFKIYGKEVKFILNYIDS